MASSNISYSKPNIGNLGKFIGDKVKSAAAMAAEERKYAKDQAEKQRKEGVPEEEIKKHDKGFFFGKALSHEFGGDLFRRTKGTFSNDPSDTEDPALTKRQRFSNLVRGGDVIAPEPFKQLELDLDNKGQGKTNVVNVEDKSLKSWLSVAFDGIQKSYDNIADKLSGITKEEKTEGKEQTKTSKSLTKIVSGLTTVKNFFTKENKLKEEENKIESQQLEFNLNQANADEMKQKETQLERGDDLSSTMSYSDPYAQGEEDEEDSGNRSLMDRMLDFGWDRNGRRRRKGFKRRYARRKFNNFRRGLGKRGRRLRRRGQVGIGRALRRIKLSEGGIATPSTSSEVSQPQVETPEAKNNIVPLSKPVETKTVKQQPQQKSVQPQQKLARGGIVDNPTKTVLSPGQAVIPLNRNNPIKNIFQQQKKQQNPNEKTASGKTISDQLGVALQLPAQAAGGLLLSTVSGVFKRLGGIGKIFAPFLSQLFRPLAKVFGLPATVVGALLGGGPAAAATMDAAGIADFLKGSGSGGKKRKTKGAGGGGGGGNPPSGTPGSLMADLEADVGKSAADMKGEISSSGATGTVDPTQQPWCAAYVNSQLQRNGIQGSGSAMADSFGKWGSPVDKNNIQPGDIIVGDYGGGSKSHVMFAAGTPKGGYVDLIGGNQSGKVTKGSIALSKIDYVRRATTGQVTSPALARTPVQNSIQPGTQAAKPNKKNNLSPSQAASNVFLSGGRKPAPLSSIDPVGSSNPLIGSFVANPVAPTYYSPW